MSNKVMDIRIMFGWRMIWNNSILSVAIVELSSCFFLCFTKSKLWYEFRSVTKFKLKSKEWVDCYFRANILTRIIFKEKQNVQIIEFVWPKRTIPIYLLMARFRFDWCAPFVLIRFYARELNFRLLLSPVQMVHFIY